MIVRLTPEACRDAEAAVSVFDFHQPGIRPLIASDLARLIARIKCFPNAYPRVRGECRQATLARFPYTVIYLMCERVIVILAIRKRPDSDLLAQSN